MATLPEDVIDRLVTLSKIHDETFANFCSLIRSFDNKELIKYLDQAIEKKERAENFAEEEIDEKKGDISSKLKQFAIKTLQEVESKSKIEERPSTTAIGAAVSIKSRKMQFISSR